MAQTQDDGFHEIQLSGKQLVFLFMAATVVSVVIFLFGVLVGRGVRAERAAAGEGGTGVAASETTPAPQPVAEPPVASPKADPRAAAAPPPAGDELDYHDRLEGKKAPAEQLKSTSGETTARRTPPPPAPAPPPVEKPAPAVTAPPPPPPPAPAAEMRAPAAAEPSGAGYAVQIAALNVRSEADAIAKRLTSKGYSAYVLAPANGTPAVFRVRVGKFSTRREAETVAAKLQKEEQFRPWVTR